MRNVPHGYRSLSREATIGSAAGVLPGPLLLRSPKRMRAELLLGLW